MNNLNTKLHLKDIIKTFEDTEVKRLFLVHPHNFKRLDKHYNQRTTLLTFRNEKKLNAADMDSVKELYTWYQTFDAFPYTFPIFRGFDNKMFCSGADLKFVFDHRNNLEEYYKYHNLSYYLFHKSYDYSHYFNKNFMFIWDGVTMGGGLGFGIYSKFRVATDSTVLAMPESQFGFFANCNFAHFIHNFVNREEALYMSLFARRYKGFEVYKKKFATHFILNKHLDSFLNDLNTINAIDENEVNKKLNFWHDKSVHEYKEQIKQNEEHLYQFDEYIKNLFNLGDKSSVINFKTFYENFSEKLKSFDKSKNDFEDFKAKSLLTHKLNYEITNSSYNPALTYEDRFNLDQDFAKISLEVGNMFEGIRAFFIDKDKAPKWKINTFEELNRIFVRT